MSELEDLKKRVAELEKATKAPEPFVPMPMPRRDLTEGMSMDRASMRRMAAVDTSGLHADLRDEAPLGSPPGVELADRLMYHQHKLDRAELIERELKLAKARMGKGDAE